MTRYAASAVRSSVNSRSGYRFRVPATAATEEAMSATTAGDGGYGFSLTFSWTGTSSCGAP